MEKTLGRERPNILIAVLSLVVVALPLRAQEWVVQTGLPDPDKLRTTDDGRVMAATSREHSVGIWRHHRLRAVLPGHDITLSRDGSLALITDQQSKPRTVSLWQTASVQQRFELSFPGWISGTAWIDHRFAVLGAHGVTIYSSSDGALLRSIDIDESRPARLDLLVSREHNFLAFRTNDAVLAWSLTEDEKLLDAACEFDFFPGRSLTTLSGDGRVLSAACKGSQRHSILVWDAAVGKQQRFGTAGLAEWLDLDDQGRRLAAGFEKSVQVYELAPEPKTNTSGELVPILDRQAKEGFRSLDLSPSGRFLFFAPSGQLKNRVVQVEAGHRQIELAAGSRLLEARFTPNEESVWAFAGQALCEWGVTRGNAGNKPLRCAGSKPWQKVTRVEVAANGRHLVTAHWDFIRSWDLETGTSEVYRGKIFALSGDGELLATGPAGGKVHIWRLADKKRLVELNQPGSITHFTASRSGRSFLTVSGNHLATWDEHGNKLWEIRESSGRPGYPAYDIELARVFVRQSDGSISGWDLANGRALPTTPLDGSGGFTRLDWVPDSPYLWTASNSRRFAVWDAVTGALVRQARPENSHAMPVAVIDEDRLVVSVCRQSRLGILSFSAPDELKVVQEQRSFVSAMEVMGETVASGTDSGELTIWAVNGQDEPLILPTAALPKAAGDAASSAIPPRHHGRIGDLAWDPQRRFLAVSDHGGVVWLWRADGSLLARLFGPYGSEWLVLAGDGRWEGSRADAPGVTVWVDDRPKPLGQFPERAEKGLLAKLIESIERKF